MSREVGESYGGLLTNGHTISVRIDRINVPMTVRAGPGGQHQVRSVAGPTAPNRHGQRGEAGVGAAGEQAELPRSLRGDRGACRSGVLLGPDDGGDEGPRNELIPK